MKKAYSFLKHETTEEMHIFEGDFTLTHCNVPSKSICKEVKGSDGTWGPNCLEEQKARVKAAELGRIVCGDCISHLYKTL